MRNAFAAGYNSSCIRNAKNDDFYRHPSYLEDSLWQGIEEFIRRYVDEPVVYVYWFVERALLGDGLLIPNFLKNDELLVEFAEDHFRGEMNDMELKWQLSLDKFNQAYDDADIFLDESDELKKTQFAISSGHSEMSPIYIYCMEKKFHFPLEHREAAEFAYDKCPHLYDRLIKEDFDLTDIWGNE
jgi:hypothetical protein